MVRDKKVKCFGTDTPGARPPARHGDRPARPGRAARSAAVVCQEYKELTRPRSAARTSRSGSPATARSCRHGIFGFENVGGEHRRGHRASASRSRPSRGAGRRATAASCGSSRWSTRRGEYPHRNRKGQVTHAGHADQRRAALRRAEALRHAFACACRASTPAGRLRLDRACRYFLPGGGAEMDARRSRRSMSCSSGEVTIDLGER